MVHISSHPYPFSVLSLAKLVPQVVVPSRAKFGEKSAMKMIGGHKIDVIADLHLHNLYLLHLEQPIYQFYLSE